MFVPIVDQHQQPLMPTTPARARRWIRLGKATPFWKQGVFCVRLNVEPSARGVQPVAVGIDPGSKKEGYSVISAAHTYLNLQADAVEWVKDVKAVTKGKRRWDQSFSPLEVGKQWFYAELAKLAPVLTKQGWETKQQREQLGLKKTGKKTARVWNAHCVDAWCLAYAQVGGCTAPDNTRLLCVMPLRWHRRQLHRLEPATSGKRLPYGGTRSLGLKRGTLVRHATYGLAYVGGTMGGKLSLHALQSGKRLTQVAKPVDCHPIKLLRWRVQLLPVL
jgi:hypothetical protein